jgi:hypothetical protein
VQLQQGGPALLELHAADRGGPSAAASRARRLNRPMLSCSAAAVCRTVASSVMDRA